MTTRIIKTPPDTLCRKDASNYLGISPRTLQKLPVPFVQYSDCSYALYKISDLDKFKESRTFAPDNQALTGKVA